MMIRAAQALRYMMTLPEWDGHTLIARGGSQGAVQAMQAAAMIEQTSLIDIYIPWLCDTQAASIGRLCGWGDFSGNAICYFDLTLRAKYTKIKTIIEAGLGDYTSPPAGVVAMYHNLGGGKTAHACAKPRTSLCVSGSYAIYGENMTFSLSEQKKNPFAGSFSFTTKRFRFPCRGGAFHRPTQKPELPQYGLFREAAWKDVTVRFRRPS